MKLPILCEVTPEKTLANDVYAPAAEERAEADCDVKVCQLALFLNPLNQSVQVWTSSLRAVSIWMPNVLYASGFGAETQRC